MTSIADAVIKRRRTAVWTVSGWTIAKADGNIVQKDIPTSLKSVVETNIPLNLGHVTKAKKILEIFDIVKGTKKEC